MKWIGIQNAKPWKLILRLFELPQEHNRIRIKTTLSTICLEIKEIIVSTTRIT